ncbi:MAG: hypothetical protein WC070_04310 [Candidatus Magasanikbacteria bacterium]
MVEGLSRDKEPKKTGNLKLVSLSELLKNDSLLKSYINCYISVFDANKSKEFGEDKSQWDEVWDEEKVLNMLMKIDSQGSDEYLNLFLNEQEEVVGFAHAYFVDNIGNITDLPKNFKDDDIKKDVVESALRFFPDVDSVLAVREFGMRADNRGGLEKLINLVVPLFKKAKLSGVNHFCFWTSKDSNLYKISQLFGFTEVYNFGSKEQDNTSNLLYFVSSIDKFFEKVKELSQK